MSVLRNGLGIVICALSVLLLSPAKAQQIEDLPSLELGIRGACPKEWESVNQLNPRLLYAAGTDIWSGDIGDKAQFIKFALANLRDENGDPLITNYKEPVQIITACSSLRALYLTVKIDAHDPFRQGFDVRTVKDYDKDGVLAFQDECADSVVTSANPVDSAGCTLSQRDTDNDGVNDAEDFCPGSPEGAAVDFEGCIPEQRDTDNDGANDAIDQCPGTTDLPSANAQGCDKFQVDTDSDGIPDFQDSYPSQHATQCQP